MNLTSFIKRTVLLPLATALGAICDLDMDEVSRIVEKRLSRAENAVLRDYVAQHGIQGEEAEQAVEELKAKRREGIPTREQLDALKERAQQAENAARNTKIDSQARIYLARLGISEQHSADVLTLAAADLNKAAENDGDPEMIRNALDSVVARLPGLTAVQQTAVSAGSMGNFPRNEDAASIMQQQLEHARATGDNAAAVSIITSAAAKGITLR